MKLTIEQAWNRGNNLLATAVLALSAFAFLPEFFIEDEWQHKIDEFLILLLGLGAIWWYKSANNRFTRSLLPVLLLVAGLSVKILAITIEIKDKEDVGDDFGALVLFVLASLFVFWLYKQSTKLKFSH